MMDENKPQPINLSDGVKWGEFTIGDFTFEAEIFEAVDLLTEIDIAHRDDPHTCRKCHSEFIVTTDDERYGRGNLYTCPACDAKAADGDIRFSQLYLDDVAKLIRERYGAPRCSRPEAYKFYRACVGLSDDLKKNAG